ncbi:MAG: BREX-2 system adenine-specific DNA-methyltransferase PglX [Myxococcales bacterium]|nr:BREX-2 system adenine-specific DNA-methyltransferase PglX [Myxococcales bacterium]
MTKALAQHVGAIAADLRAQMLAPGPVRDRAKKLHTDEQVGDDFDVWTDLLSRRAAVLWVLKTVYVRVLEDRKLLVPPRLVDPEAQDVLFDRLAPDLGDTAFLRWVFRDLASPRGGLPELFAPQPAEVAVPSNKCSEALIDFWRNKEADTGFQWSFENEEFAGELMGDLYQELDPVVKERYALCQTPDFVRDFMLGQTLTPALAELGGDAVRLLDPACGSGHFLLDGLRRIVAATAAQHPDWDKRVVVEHALERVVGIDLNDYACALARARMVMTAAELAGVKSLAEAAQFHPHVYWADGLEQVERDDERPAEQLELVGGGAGGKAKEVPPKAVLTRPSVRLVLRPILKKKFQVVVGNPPYITEKDPARKEYHREKVGRRRRYLSAHKEYSLAAPFIERCLQLAEKDGWIGLIVGNNFMKRDFGKPLIEEVLPSVDLQLVVDSSQAFIPHHGTPTVMLFARNRVPEGEVVRAVMGKRGEPGVPDEPANGKVWSGIVAGFGTLGFETEFISVADVPRATLAEHPWSLGGGGVVELKAAIERVRAEMLGKLCRSIGRTAHTGADGAYVADARVLLRNSLRGHQVASFVEGGKLRDWGMAPPVASAFPYDSDLRVIADAQPDAVIRWLWPYRSILWERREPQGTHREIGFTWHQYSRFHPERFEGLGVAYAFVATHNQFVLDHGRKVFKQTAPVIKMQAGATEDEHLALLGLLNSAAACFWMKQVFHNKGIRGEGGGTTAESWEQFYEFDATKLKLFPIPSGHAAVIPWARELDRVARQRAERSIESVLAHDGWTTTAGLRAALDARREADLADLLRMVASQEELDWECYRLYGLDPKAKGRAPDKVDGMPPTWRPVELDLAVRDGETRAAIARGDETTEIPTAWFTRHRWEPLTALPASAPKAVRELIAARRARIAEVPELALIEQTTYKRRWYRPDYDDEEQKALAVWLADRIERELSAAGAKPSSISLLAVALEGDARVAAVAELLAGRPDYSLVDLVADAILADSVPLHPFHIYKATGLDKRAAWERTWEEQRKEDAGLPAKPEVPPKYGSGDFLKPDYYRLRGKLDVPKERFIAFTEVPGRSPSDLLYGWAGWTPLERVKALLALDEQCEDMGRDLADRIALLDSAWRLLPDIARDDAATASRLKAELAALVGADGPSKVLLDAWRTRFPPPGGRARARRPAVTPDDDEDD